MLRYSNAALTQLQTDALIVDVNCIGRAPSDAFQKCCDAFDDIADAYDRYFKRGDLRPGHILTVPPTPRRSTTVFLAPSRIHPNSELRREDLRKLAKQIVDRALQRGFRSLTVLPFSVGQGLDAIEIRRELLYSLARTPELELIFWTNPAEATPPGRVAIFTDGGAKSVGGKGGYGVVLRFGDHCKELEHGFQSTTASRMELMAAVVGLEALTRPCHVRLHSDSRFVVDSVNNGLLFRRAAGKWSKKNIPALDLWKRFLKQYLKHDVEMVWVKGHSGIEDNVRCDHLATKAVESKSLAVDDGYLPTKKPDQQKRAKFKSKAKPTPKQTTKPAQTVKPVQTPTTTGVDTSRVPIVPKKSGDPCQACGCSLEKRLLKGFKPDDSHPIAWYLYCTNCKRFYPVMKNK